MKVAVIGCGYISKVHLTALQQIAGLSAVAVVDSDEKKARERAGEFKVPLFFTNWQQAFSLPEIDAAVLCLPHNLHYPCAMDALRAGKHLLIEKPISISMPEAREMIALARQKKLILMVAHMKRFDRRFVVMKQKIDEGLLGEIFMAKSEWIGPKEVFVNNPWVAFKSQGGGPLMGFGSHHIDLLLWMVGPIKKISCYTNNMVWPKVEVEDSAVAVVRFANGAIGTLIYTWGAEIYGQSENLSVYGTEGTLKLEGEDLYLISEKTYGDRSPHKLDTSRSDQQDIEKFGKEMALSSLEPFVLELRHFVECIRKKKRPLIDGAEASQAVDTIIRAYRSVKKQT
jgi:predicted dehydrogenase